MMEGLTLLLVTEENSLLGVGIIDTKDLEIEYIRLNKLIQLLRSGLEVVNINRDELLKFIDAGFIDRIDRIERVPYGESMPQKDYATGKCYYAVKDGLMFSKDFYVENKKRNFAVRLKYLENFAMRMNVLYEGSYFCFDSHSPYSNMIRINGEDIGFNRGFNYVSASYIGYDTVRRYLIYSSLDTSGSSYIIFDKGKAVLKDSKNIIKIIRSKYNNMSLTEMKRMLLFE